MTLVDRYLGAVRDNLPRAQRDDIIEELEDSLRSRMEDEAAARGRPLTEAEEAAILKDFGNPMAVAARYRGDERSVTFGRRLIGPELFPTYMKVLTVNVVITLAVGAVVLVFGASIASTFPGILVPLLIQFAIVTLVFIAIDRRYVLHPDAWDPRTVSSIGSDVDVTTVDGLADQLIGPTAGGVVRITTSILEFAVTAVALTVWVSIGLPDSSGTMAAGPAWANLYVPIAVLFAVGLIGPIVTLVRPAWTRFQVASRALFDGAFLLLLAVSLAIGDWIVLGDGATVTPDLLDTVALINSAIRVSIVVTMAFTAVSLFLELRRLRQMSSQPRI
jgi:hypothetical protein